jgi:hypothetical protein
MMTRKDYIAVSSILKEYRQIIPAEEYLELVWDFASYMKLDNDRFDNARFLEACGIPKVEPRVYGVPYSEPKPASSHVALA